MKEKKTRYSRVYLPAALFVIALLPRLLYLRDLYGTIYFDHLIIDSQAYHRSALAILDGLWGASRIFYLGPLYAFFLAGVYAIFGTEFLAVRLIQCGLGAFSAVMIYMLGRRFFSPAAGVVASILYAFYGIFIFYEGQFLATSPSVFLTLLLIIILSKEGRISALRWLGGGFVLGLAVLLRPNHLIFVPLLLFWLLMLRQGNAKKKIAGVLFFCLGTAVVILPVSLRNYLIDDDRLLVTPNGGINFYIGNNPAADGRFSPVEGIALDLDGQARDAAKVAGEALGRKPKPSEVSAFWMSRGWDYIRQHPLRAATLCGSKFLLFWNKRETRLNLDFDFHRRFSPMLRAPLSIFGFMAPFAIAGLVLSLTQWKKYYLIYIPILAGLLTVVIFFMSDRYRLPAVPFLLLFSVYGAWRLMSLISEKRWIPALLVALLVTGGVLLTRWPVAGEPPNVSSYFNLARIYERAGLISQAVAAYEKAILINMVTKSDAVVTGDCRSVSPTAHQPEGVDCTADFRIGDVLKGRADAPGILLLPCRAERETPAISGVKEPLPYFQEGERALLFLKQRKGDTFFIMGGEYGRYPLSKNNQGEWLASMYMPLGSLKSTLPDTRPAIPLAALEKIIREIMETGDFEDDPAHIDASLSRDKIEALRQAQRKEGPGRRDRNFWKN